VEQQPSPPQPAEPQPQPPPQQQQQQPNGLHSAQQRHQQQHEDGRQPWSKLAGSSGGESAAAPMDVDERDGHASRPANDTAGGAPGGFVDEPAGDAPQAPQTLEDKLRQARQDADARPPSRGVASTGKWLPAAGAWSASKSPLQRPS